MQQSSCSALDLLYPLLPLHVVLHQHQLHCQADDSVILSSSPHQLGHLLQLTLLYCHKYKVELTPEKTQLQVVSPPSFTKILSTSQLTILISLESLWPLQPLLSMRGLSAPQHLETILTSFKEQLLTSELLVLFVLLALPGDTVGILLHRCAQKKVWIACPALWTRLTLSSWVWKEDSFSTL